MIWFGNHGNLEGWLEVLSVREASSNLDLRRILGFRPIGSTTTYCVAPIMAAGQNLEISLMDQQSHGEVQQGAQCFWIGLENIFYFLLLRCQLMRTVEFVHKDSPQSKDIQFFAADVDCCEPRRSFLCGDAAKPSARMGKSGWRRGSVESSDSGSYIEKDNQLSLIHQQTFFWRAYLSLQFSSIFLEHYSYM